MAKPVDINEFRERYEITSQMRPRHVSPDKLMSVMVELWQMGYHQPGKGRPKLNEKPLWPMVCAIFDMNERSLRRVLQTRWPNKRGLRTRDRFKNLFSPVYIEPSKPTEPTP